MALLSEDVRCTQLLRLAAIGNISVLKQYINDNYDQDHEWQSVFHRKSGDSLPILACRYGFVELLVKFKLPDLERANLDGKRPLHEAVQNGHRHCLDYLLNQGVQVDCLKRSDWTPLMLSCTKCDLVIIQALLNHNANPQLLNKDGWNCLHIAVREGFPEVINLLLDFNGDLWNTRSKNGRTPLHTAALHGRLEAVKILLTRGNYEPDTTDCCGTTPLMDALRSGHVDIADILIQRHRADVSKRDRVGGRQALHLAAQSGCCRAIVYLVKLQRIFVDVKSSEFGDTPLHLAAKEGHVEAVQLLLNLGADVKVLNKNGRSALDSSKIGKHSVCEEILLNWKSC